MRIKICGITRAEDARLASDLGAWAIGLIFVPSSPRALDLRAAHALRSAIGPDTLAIGVFGEAGAAEIREAVKACQLDAVQLHGDQTPQECAEAGAPVYKALSFASPADSRQLEAYAGSVAGFLVETVRRLPGGREKVELEESRLRWQRARGLTRFGTVLLAGELTPLNVADAARLARPSGVDVCGGVEAQPGKKDPAKLQMFFEAVRSVRE